ncbi:hypothetical protein ACFWPQ_44035 [Streptomyces sp. NPDC058464]|uniref:effector-associated constant component EACC1 n=1 Tax=Streptomyces sp. NPDC058464 TaxID=3346511 RepID=UPI00366335FE
MASHVVAVSVSPGDDESDELQSLRSWIEDEAELAAAVRAGAGSEVAGTLGTVTDVLLITLGPGGAAGALAAVLVTWIRSRRKGTVIVRVRRPDGAEWELEAGGLSAMGAQEVQQMTRALADWTGTHEGTGATGGTPRP